MSPSSAPLASPYWFPAKRYGWGWGLPNVWQGWVVYAAYVGLLIGLAVAFQPDTQFALFLACTFLLSGILMAVCWLKGEPPRWRWGK